MALRMRNADCGFRHGIFITIGKKADRETLDNDNKKWSLRRDPVVRGDAAIYESFPRIALLRAQ